MQEEVLFAVGYKKNIRENERWSHQHIIIIKLLEVKVMFCLVDVWHQYNFLYFTFILGPILGFGVRKIALLSRIFMLAHWSIQPWNEKFIVIFNAAIWFPASQSIDMQRYSNLNYNNYYYCFVLLIINLVSSIR